MTDYRIDYNAKKIVQPRKNSYEHLSIIAVDLNAELIWTETTQDYQPLERLPVVVLQEPDSMIVGYEVGIVIKRIVQAYADTPRFQVKATPVVREIAPWKAGEVRRQINHGISFSFIGWKRTVNKNSSWERRHYPVDPALFTASFKSEYQQKDKSLITLIEWAYDLRSFLQTNNLSLKGTQSAIAAQLLRDSRFYSTPRRKIPKATNKQARDTLPGNFYMYAGANPDLIYKALEVDQKSSHHSIASTLRFPSADSLYAKGYFRSLPNKVFAMRGSRLFNRLINQHGLFYGCIRVPRRGAQGTPFLIPQAEYLGVDKTGYKCCFFFSNEVRELLATGCEIEYVIAAWTSEETDDGLNRFALWSLEQLANADATRKRWLKPLLLSVYGLLATRPKPMVSAYLRGNTNGELTFFHVGRGEVIELLKYETSRQFEPAFANVIHRGMIEAETRIRSLEMARWLSEQGFNVLTVYADAVYAEGPKQMKFLPPGWETKEIRNAHFPNANQVVCDEFIKLPGLTGKQRKIVAREIQETGTLRIEAGDATRLTPAQVAEIRVSESGKKSSENTCNPVSDLS